MPLQPSKTVKNKRKKKIKDTKAPLIQLFVYLYHVNKNQ